MLQASVGALCTQGHWLALMCSPDSCEEKDLVPHPCALNLQLEGSICEGPCEPQMRGCMLGRFHSSLGGMPDEVSRAITSNNPSRVSFSAALSIMCQALVDA